MRAIPVVFAAFALAGCTPADRPAPPGTGGPVECDAGRAQAFVGQDGAAVAERARIAASARTIRRIRPGEAVTMDFRADRLNIDVDDSGKITALRCG